MRVAILIESPKELDMLRKLFFTALFLIALISVASAQETLKSLTLSNEFSGIAGTPRVTRNGFKHLWLVAWRQNGNPAKIMGRLVQSDGVLGASKIMASGVTPFEQNFDISYDAINYTYILAYENAQGLVTQFFNANFVKTGGSSLIEAGVTNSMPRIAYDGAGKKFLIFWTGTQDGTPNRVLKSRVLDVTGKPSGDIRNLATAPAGKTWHPNTVSTNPQNGNLIVMVLEKAGNTGSLIGFTAKADGTLLRAAPSRFQPSTAGLNTVGDSSFVDAGTGFGIWSDKTSIKYRKIGSTGTFASGTKSISNAADANSIQASIVNDTRNNQFLGVWTESNQVRSAALNTSSGSVIKPPFSVATSSLTNTRNASTSYDPQQGNVIVVWEDSNAAASTPGGSTVRFKTRGAIFFLGSGGGGPTPASVNIGDNFFSPASLSVPTGTVVKWTSQGQAQHTVTSDNSAFDSSTMNRNDTFEFRFTQQGTFNYHCTIHGQSMSGTITVTADQEPPPRY
jgi:plastocyanin